MNRLKKCTWLLRNARLRDVVTTYCCPGRIPMIRIERALFVLSQGPGMNLELPSQPFLLVKCIGFQFHDRLKDFLNKTKIDNTYIGRFKGYGHAAMQIYHIDPIRNSVEDWIWLGILQHIAPEKWDEADVWTIDCSEKKIPWLKKRIRRKVGLQFYRAQYLDTTYTVTMNPVHTPDKSKISSEWEILSSCLYR